jgi:alpha-galactosidase
MHYRQYTKKKVRGAVLFLAVTLLVAAMFAGMRPFVCQADNVSDLKKSIEQKQNEIKDAENQKKKLQSGLTDVKSIISDLEKSKKTLSSYVSQLDSNLSEVQAKITEIKEMIAQKEAEIVETKAELDAAVAQEEAQYEGMKARIKSMYERGDDFYFEAVLTSKSFGEMLNRAEYVEKISSSDKRMLEEFRATREYVEVCKAQLESEQELPVIFNEYCTTWGEPSHENICGILEAVKDKGFSYFVIDCGWYKQEGIPWDVAMGDYQVSKELFPDGLDKTVKAINDHGMKAGIWFEIDNVGEKAESYQDTAHLLTRNSRPLTTSMRRFWDMRQEWVQKYLEERVIGTLEKYGFAYMKMDYNDTIGVGCDGAESLGEGLRQNMEASLAFIRKVKERIPGIILENCSSGGHKLEPLMMGECSMASFSDAHECEEIPIIAAALHRVILPRQSQIWAVIREADSLKRIAYSIANTFLGRMCLSGDVTRLTDAQWDVIDRGIAFYKKAAPIIKDGYSRLYGPKVTSWRHPEGWQCLVRTQGGVEHEKKDGLLAVFHSFNGMHDGALEVPLPEDGTYRVEEVYSDAEADVIVADGRLVCRIPEDMRAVAVLAGKN